MAKGKGVAPYMGAWIETLILLSCPVAPYMGAWIETALHGFALRCRTTCVAPYMGAWIETLRIRHGGVD